MREWNSAEEFRENGNSSLSARADGFSFSRKAFQLLEEAPSECKELCRVRDYEIRFQTEFVLYTNLQIFVRSIFCFVFIV